MMSGADPGTVFVHLLPSLIPPGALTGGIAVVVDVLRATTVMVEALASGCTSIIPCLEIDEALSVAASLPPGTAILGGERQGLPIEGFDLGNSPGSYTPEVCLGKTLVMTTTNGTRAILASLEAERVLVAAFTNLAATLLSLITSSGPIHIVCSGTDGRISLEDSLLAGALATRIGQPPGNDEATMVKGLWESVSPNGSDDYRVWLDFLHLEVVKDVAERAKNMEPGDSRTQMEGLARSLAESARLLTKSAEDTTPSATRKVNKRWLLQCLRLGRGGRRVREIGLAPDLEDASRLDRYPKLAAELHRDPLRIVGSEIL